MTTTPPTAERRGHSATLSSPEVVRTNNPDTPTLHTDRARFYGTTAVTATIAAVYVLFVAHYSINVIFWDEWDSVPIVHAALHSHLTLSALWAQHNENRILLPNLVVVASALVEHYNSKSIILLGAFSFVASFVILLVIFRHYLRHALTPIHVLTLGVVWFSLEDTENSLWAFQLAWYLIVIFLLAMIFLLAPQRRHRNLVVAGAALFAIAASMSSLQGLLLWPVGLICLLWSRTRERRLIIECAVWLVMCGITAALYFHNFNFQTTGSSPGFALRHPFGMAKFFLASLGNVVPTTHSNLRIHELIGAVVFIGATFVVVQSFRDKTMRDRNPLPIALISFGVLFDGSIVLGRISFGIGEALSPRYTMANLLVLTGIVVFAWGYSRPTTHLTRHAVRPTTARRVGFILLGLFLVVQVVDGTAYGISSGRTYRQNRLTAARIVVNLDRIPGPEQQRLAASYVFPNVTALRPFLQEARSDNLSVFAPGPYRFYRLQGPPST